MAMKVRIDEAAKKVFIEAEIEEVASKTGINTMLITTGGFPKAVDGLKYKGKPVKLSLSVLVDSDMPESQKKAIKDKIKLERARAQVASLEKVVKE